MEHFLLDSAGHSRPHGVSHGGSRSVWRRHPLVLGAGAGVVILGLAGVGAMTGLIPTAGEQKAASQPARASGEARREARPARVGVACATCGTVESVRPVEFERRTVHRVTVRMDDGSYRTISQPVAPGIGPGEKVQIVDGAVVAGR